MTRPTKTLADMPELKTKYNPRLPVKDVFYDVTFNCRQEFSLQSVADLAENIHEVGGILHPLVVQLWDAEPGFTYRLIIGHRRFLAATRYLKWKTIPANIVLSPLSNFAARHLNVMENLERADLSIWETAMSIRNLYPEGSTATLREIAAAFKRPTAWVRIRQKLLTMPEAVQQAAHAGTLSQIVLSELSRMEDGEEQTAFADAIATARQKNGKHLRGLDPKFRLGTRSKTKGVGAINRKIEELFEMNLSGLATRALAWAAQAITDEEFRADCEEEIKRD